MKVLDIQTDFEKFKYSNFREKLHKTTLRVYEINKKV